jgi:hypothetical protein
VTSRRPVFALVGLALVLFLASCNGGDGEKSVSSRDETPTTTSDPTGSNVGSNTADAYVGLTKKAAIAKAEADGRPWRIGREDDESFPATLDYNPERVTFEIDDGKVTQATFG